MDLAFMQIKDVGMRPNVVVILVFQMRVVGPLITIADRRNAAQHSALEEIFLDRGLTSTFVSFKHASYVEDGVVK
jgi:hypothetical protein